MATTIKATEVLSGMEFTFTITSNKFKVSKVTDKRISWFVNPHKSGCGINIMKVAWVSIKQFQEGIDEGIYILNN